MTRVVVGTIALIFCVASVAEALNFTSWVSSTGNDANACERSSPCATFAKAFQATLADGRIIVLDPGNYGRLTITHAVTIDGGANVLTPLDFDSGTGCGTQITINAGSSDHVVIRNLAFRGLSTCQPTGIRANTVGDLHVEHCWLAGYTDRAIDFRATGAHLYLSDVIIDNVDTYGVYVGNAFASIDHLTANNNGTGVLAAGSAAVTIAHSTANGNGIGFGAAYGPTAQLNLDDCVMTANQWAVVVSQGATAYVTNSSVFNNSVKGLFNDGVSFLVSYGTNRFAGNASDGSFTVGMALR